MTVMKPSAKLLMLSACLITRSGFSATVLPGAYGTDGARNIADDTVIDLSQASMGTPRFRHGSSVRDAGYFSDRPVSLIDL
jgi:hypothetical protein